MKYIILLSALVLLGCKAQADDLERCRSDLREAVLKSLPVVQRSEPEALPGVPPGVNAMIQAMHQSQQNMREAMIKTMRVALEQQIAIIDLEMCRQQLETFPR
jgi:Tfp pilus assembly protein PilP